MIGSRLGPYEITATPATHSLRVVFGWFAELEPLASRGR